MDAKLEPHTIPLQASAMPVAAICRRCREETARYRRGEPSDGNFCLEIFRRAIAERDEDCWQELHSIYRDQVVSWCRRASSNAAVDLDELVALTWEKFWRNYTSEKLAVASGSAAVLSYLKMCARSAATDVARSRPPAQSLDEEKLEPPDGNRSPAEAHAARDTSARFWALINACLSSEAERVLVHLTYELGLKPAEIHAQRPDLCPSIQDVYRVTRNVLDRLKRNRELRAWFEQEGL